MTKLSLTCVVLQDYDELVSIGANLTGKIVITRYGQLFRGLKVGFGLLCPKTVAHSSQIKGAAELGAAGVLIYSDPRDDGSTTVENGFSPYPAGPARNPTSVQRGSVVYLSFYPGDPTTPGYPAYENAERMEGSNIPTIPSLPISWRNAERLLKEIGDIYVIGEDGKRKLSGIASASKVRLINHGRRHSVQSLSFILILLPVDTKVTPIWNTMAAIPGRIRDEVVIVGCHRDGNISFFHFWCSSMVTIA